MKKILFLCTLMIGLFVGCSTSNVNPTSSYEQQLSNVVVTVTRVDINAIHVTVKNDRTDAVTIDWNKSTINDKSIVKDNVEDFKTDIKDTILNSGESIDAVLYVKDSISYRNPVLYQPGGYYIDTIKYPATLNIVIDNVKNIKTVNF